MMPRNINRTHVLMAMREIDTEGIPKGRGSKRFQLFCKGKNYPPKYVIPLANKARAPCFCPDHISFQLLKRAIFFFGRTIALLFRTCIHSQLPEEP